MLELFYNYLCYYQLLIFQKWPEQALQGLVAADCLDPHGYNSDNQRTAQAHTLLVTTKGFANLKTISNQDQPDIFDLTASGLALLHKAVVEINKRMALQWSATKEDIREVVVLATGKQMGALRHPDPNAVRNALTKVCEETSIWSVAVCMLHSFTHDTYKSFIGEFTAEFDFTQILLSSTVMSMVKAVSCTHTACAVAYLTSAMETYLETSLAGFDNNLSENTRMAFMRSDSGLASADAFNRLWAVLSGLTRVRWGTTNCVTALYRWWWG